MSSEANITVTVKTKAGTLFTIRGDEPEEFAERVRNAVFANLHDSVGALEELALMAAPGTAHTQSTPIAPVAVAPAPSPIDLVTETFGATVISETAVTPSFAPVPPPAQAQPEGVRTVTDRWGNQWTYGRPDAPVCAHGTMVLKKGTSKAGKSYVGWFDPAGGPEWTAGKVDNQCDAKFGVKV